MGFTSEVALLMGEGLTEEEAWIEVMYSRGKLSTEEYNRRRAACRQERHEEPQKK